MPVTVSFTETDVFTVLRSLLMTMAPGADIIRAQVNRVPEPKTDDFIVVTQLRRERLMKPVETYVDTWPSPGSSKTVVMPVKADFQLDIHGPASAEHSQIITSLFFNAYTTDWFDASGIAAQALFASDPRQIPFINAENQYETRWVVELSLQLNQVVTIPQDFAGELQTGIISVDVVYPP